MQVFKKIDYYKTWFSMLDIDIQAEFIALQQKELDPHSFTFYTSVSVMSSSKIEGEEMEVDSYVKHKMLNVEYLPELTQKPNDLYNAYLFAKDNTLSELNFSKAHALVSEHLLPLNQRGVLRNTEMLVMEHKTGKIQYEATPKIILKKEYMNFWKEVAALIKQDLTIEQVFYYAAIIHLVFVNIHPFNDGNGRSARLLEKWFLAEKLGERAWYLQTEKYYYKNVNEYYKNLSRLGFFYEVLDYEKALPFLLMIPKSLVFDK
jgi:Fic family protein